jgi:release factor glutamine methyltransferase
MRCCARGCTRMRVEPRRRPPPPTPAQPGPHRRPQRADPHLQLPGEPDRRSPHRVQGVQPRPGPRRGSRSGGAVLPGRRRGGAARTPRGRFVTPPISPVPAPEPVEPVGPVDAGGLGGRLAGALRAATARLEAAGVASPQADAVALASHLLDTSYGDVRRAAVLGAPVPAGYAELVARPRRARAAAAPHRVAHFRRLTLSVGPGVFIPRPETEVLVGHVVAELTRLAAVDPAAPAPIVVDLCTGSGVIALAVADEIPCARVWAVEKSPQAATYARANVTASGRPVTLVVGDAADPLPELAGLTGAVDVVTCNPPYIPDGMVPIDPEVRDHDPELALYGRSADGLAVPLRMAARAAALLRPGGLLAMEHGDAQGESLPAALAAQGPLAGRPRRTRPGRPATCHPRAARVRAGGKGGNDAARDRVAPHESGRSGRRPRKDRHGLPRPAVRPRPAAGQPAVRRAAGLRPAGLWPAGLWAAGVRAAGLRRPAGHALAPAAGERPGDSALPVPPPDRAARPDREGPRGGVRQADAGPASRGARAPVAGQPDGSARGRQPAIAGPGGHSPGDAPAGDDDPHDGWRHDGRRHGGWAACCSAPSRARSSAPRSPTSSSTTTASWTGTPAEETRRSPTAGAGTSGRATAAASTTRRASTPVRWVATPPASAATAAVTTRAASTREVSTAVGFDGGGFDGGFDF